MKVIPSNDFVMKSIHKEFTMELPNAFYIRQKYKRGGGADGFVRLYNLKTKQMRIGLLGKLIEFAVGKGFTYSTYNFPEKESKKNEIVEFVNSLKLLDKRKKQLELRKYQKITIAEAISRKRCLLESATASGKSAAIYGILKYFIGKGKKIALIVPNVSLVTQLYNDIAIYSNYDSELLRRISKLHAQSEDKKDSAFKNTDVLITTWQSLIKQDESFMLSFDVLLADEVHRYKSHEISKCLDKMINCDYRIGLTGTLGKEKTDTTILIGLFGEIKKIITAGELINQGYASDMEIEIMVLKYPKEDAESIIFWSVDGEGNDVLNKLEYMQELNFLHAHKKRQDVVIEKLKKSSSNGTVLVLFNRVASFGVPLYERVKEEFEGKRKIYYISGSIDAKEREKIRQEAMRESGGIIVANYTVLSTGVNLPNIDTIFIASPLKEYKTVVQTLGRGLRREKGKEKCVVVDFADDLRNYGVRNTMYNQYLSRKKIYQEEGLKFFITNKQL